MIFFFDNIFLVYSLPPCLKQANCETAASGDTKHILRVHDFLVDTYLKKVRVLPRSHKDEIDRCLQEAARVLNERTRFGNDDVITWVCKGSQTPANTQKFITRHCGN
jgi:hypothetical protein